MEQAGGIRDLQAYVHRRVDLQLGSRRIEFDTSLDLFSSAQVDVGSEMLIRSLDRLGIRSTDIGLDLGCGYGVLAIAAACHFDVRMHATDRDALAVAFTRHNAVLNSVGDDFVRAYGSLGFDDVQRTFDFIVSNIPGKAGEPVIRSLIAGAQHHLNAGGTFAVVVIDSIRDAVQTFVREIGGEVTFTRSTRNYTILHARFDGPLDGPNGFPAGSYDRAEVPFKVGARLQRVRTVYGLPSESGPGIAESLILSRAIEVARRGGTILVLNCGQGFVPVGLAVAFSPERLVLVDPDLLALRATQRNLQDSGFPASRVLAIHGDHYPDELSRFSLIVGTPDVPSGAYEAVGGLDGLTRQLDPDGVAILVTTGTSASRMLQHTASPGFEAARSRRKGMNVLTVKHR